MKRKSMIAFGVVGLIIGAYVVFMAGRFSYLITEPEVFLSPKEKWAVSKAREYALANGIAGDRLKNPKVIDAVRVYFGGMGGLGGVEITMMKDNGGFLDSKY